jgi:hypothetical protein
MPRGRKGRGTHSRKGKAPAPQRTEGEAIADPNVPRGPGKTCRGDKPSGKRKNPLSDVARGGPGSREEAALIPSGELLAGFV